MIIVNNRDKIEWNRNMTVQDVLDIMGYTYRLITVTVNHELVLVDDYSTYLVPDEAQITIFHLAHGG